MPSPTPDKERNLKVVLPIVVSEPLYTPAAPPTLPPVVTIWLASIL